MNDNFFVQSNIILKDKVAILNLTFNFQMYFVIAEIKIVVSTAEKIIWSKLTFCFFFIPILLSTWDFENTVLITVELQQF